MEKLTRYAALILIAFSSVFAFADTPSESGRIGESGMMNSGMMDGSMMSGGMMIVCVLAGLLVLTLLVLGILALVKFLRGRKSKTGRHPSSCSISFRHVEPFEPFKSF